MSSTVLLFCMRKSFRLVSEEGLALVARRFALLSEPMRLKLLHALFDGEKPVNALVEATGGTQANVSRHLQALADGGILARRKEGLQVIYSIKDPTIHDLCELVCSSLERQHARQAAALGR